MKTRLLTSVSILTLFCVPALSKGRAHLSAPIPFSAMVYPGPAMDLSSGTGQNQSGNYFGRKIVITIKNMSKETQTVTVTARADGIEWNANLPAPVSLEPSQAGVIVKPPTTNGLIEVPGLPQDIAPNESFTLSYELRFWGPTNYVQSFFNALASLSFQFDITQETGIVTAGIASSLLISKGEPPASLNSMDFVDAALSGTNFTHTMIPVNGGRPF